MLVPYITTRRVLGSSAAWQLHVCSVYFVPLARYISSSGIAMSRSQQGVQERYRRALDALTQKLQQDRTVLAAIIYGSYSYDQVWEKSDIDLWIVMADDPKVRRYEDHCLTERRRHHPRQPHPAQALPVEHRRLAPRRLARLYLCPQHPPILQRRVHCRVVPRRRAHRRTRPRLPVTAASPSAIGHLGQSPEVVPGEEGLQLQLPVAPQRGRPARQRRVHPQRPSPGPRGHSPSPRL